MRTCAMHRLRFLCLAVAACLLGCIATPAAREAYRRYPQPYLDTAAILREAQTHAQRFGVAELQRLQAMRRNFDAVGWWGQMEIALAGDRDRGVSVRTPPLLYTGRLSVHDCAVLLGPLSAALQAGAYPYPAFDPGIVAQLYGPAPAAGEAHCFGFGRAAERRCGGELAKTLARDNWEHLVSRATEVWERKSIHCQAALDGGYLDPTKAPFAAWRPAP